MNKAQDFIEAFTCIPEQFTDLERRETFAQILQTRDGKQMVITIGRGTRTRQRPDHEETIVDNIEGFGFVTEVMFPARAGWLLTFLRAVGIGSGLIGTGIVDIGSLRVLPGCEAAMIVTGGCIAGAALFVLLAGRAGTLSRRLRTGWNLVAALHVRTRSDQLAIGGNGGDPSKSRFPIKYEIDYVRVYQKK